MFERFTTDSRNAVTEAQIIARQAGSRSIDARHVLIALVERSGAAAAALDSVGVDRNALAAELRAQLDERGLDASALASLGVDLDAVRRRADQVFGAGALDRSAPMGRRGHIPFASDAKKSLELSVRQAARAGSSNLHSGMLLLGILACTGSPAQVALIQALEGVGFDPDALRAAVAQPQAKAG